MQRVVTTMEKWAGCVAMVTGAASGIGAAVSQELAKHGMKVIGCDIDLEHLNKLKETVAKDAETMAKNGLLHPIKCDLTKEAEILAMFKSIEEEFNGVDVCVNVAGVGHKASIIEGQIWQWRHMLDVNVMAYALCARESITHMLKRDVTGHVINICSMAGHRIRPNRADFTFYNMTKFAITAMTEGLKYELTEKSEKIRVSQISPGVVETQFTHKMYEGHPDDVTATDELYKKCKVLQAQDLADGVVFMLSRPDHVQIHDMWMTPQAGPHV